MRAVRSHVTAVALALALVGAAVVVHGEVHAQQRPAAPSQASGAPGWQKGRPWTGPSGVRESVARIQERERLAPPVPPVPIVRRHRLRPERDLPQDPNSPELPHWPPVPAAAPRAAEAVRAGEDTAPHLPQTFGTSFLAARLSDSGFIPPDSMGDVGPTQYIVMVNGRIRSFDKATGTADGVLNASTDVFFDSVRDNSGTSDPRVRYDRLSGRWILIIINVGLPNRVLIAVSDSSTITNSSEFTFFFIPIDTIEPALSATCLFDYPTLGVDAHALYIGGNNFCGSSFQTLSFSNTDAFVVQKSSILGAGPMVVTAFRNLIDAGTREGPFTPQGVDNFDPSATEGYLIGVDNRFFGRLSLRRISDPGGTPSISANIPITVNSTSFPVNVPHLGMTAQNRLDALDDRLYAAHIRNGRLWTAHNIAVNTSGVGTNTGGQRRTGSRWYELTGIATGGTPAVVQIGTLFDSASQNPLYYWIPSIGVSGQGHAALGFSRAGANARADAGVAGRLASDTLATLQTPVLYTSSTTAYNVQNANPQRWGDYSYVSVDPDDDMTMWTVQEWCDATNSWGVQVVKLVAPPPATPSSAAPTVIATGQSSVEVTINGASTAGSGFFDPGEGFPKRISASVSGGIVVNRVTYVNPTTVILDLDTTAATGGSHSVTITNPDGQSATGASILPVTSAATAAVSISSSGSPTVVGQSVTFTAEVTGGSGTPTGTVQFLDGEANLSTPVLLDGAGQAQLVVTSLSAGAHSITAVYSGDSTYLGGSSAPLAHTVHKAATSAALDSSPNPSVFSQPATLTATISPVAPGGGTADGSVEFFDGETSLGTALVSSGVATLITSQIGLGSRSLTAVYLGSASYTGSTSPARSHTTELKKRPGQLISPEQQARRR